MKGVAITQTLAQMKALLASHGLHPKHRHGQHFLHDHHHLQRIVAHAEVQPNDLVLEVGPGTGVLSVALLEAGARLIAVEIDADLAPLLAAVLAPYDPRGTLLIADVLASKHRINDRVVEALRDADTGVSTTPPPFKMVANLPYTIATPLIANLVTHWPQMTSAVVTVQREMADRLTAAVDTADYGPLTIVVRATSQVTRIADVPASCFWPIPKVESSIIQIVRRERPLIDDVPRLAEVARRLFAQRRKQLGSILRHQFPGQSLPAAIEPSLRPQALELPQVLALAEVLVPPRTPPSKGVARSGEPH